MGRPFKQYLNGPRIYSCSNCRSHVADHDDIISKVWVFQCMWMPSRSACLLHQRSGLPVPRAHYYFFRGAGHLDTISDAASQAFQGRHGRAYLFSNV